MTNAKWRCAIHGYVVSQKPLPGCLECEAGVRHAKALDDAKVIAMAALRLMGILVRVLRQTTDVEAPCQVVRGHCQVHGYDTDPKIALAAKAAIADLDALLNKKVGG